MLLFATKASEVRTLGDDSHKPAGAVAVTVQLKQRLMMGAVRLSAMHAMAGMAW